MFLMDLEKNTIGIGWDVVIPETPDSAESIFENDLPSTSINNEHCNEFAAIKRFKVAPISSEIGKTDETIDKPNDQQCQSQNMFDSDSIDGNLDQENGCDQAHPIRQDELAESATNDESINEKSEHAQSNTMGQIEKPELICDAAVELLFENDKLVVNSNEMPSPDKCPSPSPNEMMQNLFEPTIGCESEKINIADLVDALVTQESDIDGDAMAKNSVDVEEVSVDELIQMHTDFQDRVSCLLNEAQETL